MKDLVQLREAQNAYYQAQADLIIEKVLRKLRKQQYDIDDLQHLIVTITVYHNVKTLDSFHFEDSYVRRAWIAQSNLPLKRVHVETDPIWDLALDCEPFFCQVCCCLPCFLPVFLLSKDRHRVRMTLALPRSATFED